MSNINELLEYDFPDVDAVSDDMLKLSGISLSKSNFLTLIEAHNSLVRECQSLTDRLEKLEPSI